MRGVTSVKKYIYNESILSQISGQNSEILLNLGT